jgi:hypothetical protein
MTQKSFFALCAVTALAVVIAGFAILNRPAIEASDFDGTLMFPDLVEDLNDLATVKIAHKDGAFTLNSTGDGWVFAERDNHPVQDDKIGELLIKLTRMEKVEPKTELPDRYDRLDLGTPEEKEDTRAKVVSLLDSEGDEIAALVVGKRKFTLGTDEGGTYVKEVDDPQTWLVTGELNPGARARDWLVREVSDIKDDDIARITITHPDGEVVSVYKNAPEDANYLVENIPAGQELRRDTIANDTGRVLSNLLLDDVAKADSVAFPEDQTIRAVFEGFAGFSVTVDLVEDGDNNWIRISGTAPSGPAEPTVAQAAAEGAEAAAEAEAEAEGAEPKDWPAIIADLNARSAGWVYQLPGFEVAGIKKRMEEFVREIEDDGV